MLSLWRYRLVEKKWASPEPWDDVEFNARITYNDIYEELRPLGKGANAIVTLVRRRADNELLAVKKVQYPKP